MSRDTAMLSYIDELKKIIETMSYTDNVADFMGSISELDGVSVEDLEAVAPEAIQKVRSQPNSPFGECEQEIKFILLGEKLFFNVYLFTASREASPVRAPHVVNHNTHTNLTNGHHPSSQNNGVLTDALAVMNGNGYHNGHTTEQSDDEYIDTIDDYEAQSYTSDSTVNTTSMAAVQNHASRAKVRYQQQQQEPSHQGTSSSSSRGRMVATQAAIPASVEVDLRFHNVLSELNMTVERINLDVKQVMTRMAVMEKALNEAKVRERWKS